MLKKRKLIVSFMLSALIASALLMISPITIKANASVIPSVTNVNVSGNGIVGNTLTVNYTYSGLNEDNSQYQWLIAVPVTGFEAIPMNVSYQIIEGAIGRTYTMADGDLGKYIRVDVTPRDINNNIGTTVRSDNYLSVSGKKFVIDFENQIEGSNGGYGIQALINSSYNANGGSVAVVETPENNYLKLQTGPTVGTTNNIIRGHYSQFLSDFKQKHLCASVNYFFPEVLGATETLHAILGSQFGVTTPRALVWGHYFKGDLLYQGNTTLSMKYPVRKWFTVKTYILADGKYYNEMVVDGESFYFGAISNFTSTFMNVYNIYGLSYLRHDYTSIKRLGQIYIDNIEIAESLEFSKKTINITRNETVDYSFIAKKYNSADAEITYSVVGDLPAGLNLNSLTGKLTGFVNLAGIYKINVKAECEDIYAITEFEINATKSLLQPPVKQDFIINYIEETITFNDLVIAASDVADFSVTIESGAIITPGKTYYTKKLGNDNEIESSIFELIIDNRPVVPVLSDIIIRSTSVNIPYVQNRIVYISGGVFEELTPNTEYTLSAYFEATINSFKSETIEQKIKTLNKYSVTFRSPYGDIYTEQVDHGYNVINTPVAPQKTGYTFDNWDFSYENIQQETVINAIYTPNQYTITFTGEGINEFPILVIYNEELATLPIPSREGLTFVNWKYNFIFYTTNSIYNIASDAEFVAVWTDKNVFNITFKYNIEGVSDVVIKVIEEEKVFQPQTPSREGYTFYGWFLNNQAFNFDTLISADIILEATWVINQYTITVDGEERQIDYGTEIVLIPKNEAHKHFIKYVFSGLNIGESSNNSYTFLMPANAVSVVTVNEWNIYTVLIDSDENGTAEGGLAGIYNTQITVTARNNEGYHFLGWYINEELVSESETYTFNLQADITLKARFDINKYEVIFVLDGTTVRTLIKNHGQSVDSFDFPEIPIRVGHIGVWEGYFENITSDLIITAVYNKVDDIKIVFYTSHTVEKTLYIQYYETLKLSDPFNRKAYRLLGWAKELNGILYYQITDEFVITENMEFYAIWEIIECEISFSLEGSIYGESALYYYYDKIIQPVEPSKAGFLFSGWYKDNSYTIRWDFNNDIATESIVLYGKFYKIVYSVIYITNGGEAIQSQFVEYEEKIEIPETPFKEGYTFKGWHTNDALTSEYDFNNKITNSFSLYAAWEINEIPQVIERGCGSALNEESIFIILILIILGSIISLGTQKGSKK